ncbi:MAG: ABC transporter permease, partial [Anaerolineales bacterium]
MNSLRSLPHTVKRARPWLGLISLAFGLTVWWAAARFGGLPSFILPSPIQVWQRFMLSLATGELVQNSAVTLLEVLLGLLWGVAFAVIFGYLLGKSRALEQLLSPYLVASQAVPLVAIAPLLVIWFGPGL